MNETLTLDHVLERAKEHVMESGEVQHFLVFQMPDDGGHVGYIPIEYASDEEAGDQELDKAGLREVDRETLMMAGAVAWKHGATRMFLATMGYFKLVEPHEAEAYYRGEGGGAGPDDRAPDDIQEAIVIYEIDSGSARRSKTMFCEIKRMGRPKPEFMPAVTRPVLAGTITAPGEVMRGFLMAKSGNIDVDDLEVGG